MKKCHKCNSFKDHSGFRSGRHTCKACNNKRPRPRIDYTCRCCGKIYTSTKNNERRKKNKSVCASCSIKKCWQDKEYRQSHVVSLRKAHNTESAKKAHSSASKKNFENEDFKSAAIERINSKKSREKAIANIKAAWRDEDKAREMSRKMWKTRQRKVSCSKGIVEVKSSYEERAIKLLDSFGFRWEYEPRSFLLEKLDKIYIPDFYIEELDLWIEVKGYWYRDAKEKWDAWIEQHPELNVVVFNRVLLGS